MTRWHGHFETRLANQLRFILEVMAEVIGETRTEISDEIEAKVTESRERAELAGLQSSVDELRQDLKHWRAPRDEVIEPPNPLTKHVN